MTQFLYQEQTISSNVTYGILGHANLLGEKKFRDMSGYTVIIVSDDFVDDNSVRNVADIILKRGCKNIAFCGESSELIQEIVDQEDREVNGYNDVTGYDDFAVTRKFEDIEDLSEEIEMCWGEVLILCTDIRILRECQDIVRGAAC